MQAPTALTAAVDSPEGRAWMAAVPSLLHDLARQWNLITTGDLFWHGCHAVVFPVRQGSRPLALKLAWPADQTRGEAHALTEWRGRGIVVLVAADVPRGALLLERLNASRSLTGIPLAEAAATAGTLARTLAIEASGSFPSVRVEASHLATTILARQRSLHDPVSGQWIALAARLAADLADDPARLLVHSDLHYGNILASKRPGQPWVAIDPRAAVGAPRTFGGGPALDPGRRASRRASHHRPARHHRREREPGPGQGNRLGLRPNHRLLALGTGERAHGRSCSMPANRQRLGTPGRARQPAMKTPSPHRVAESKYALT
jgi:streptomycin 6-kinase